MTSDVSSGTSDGAATICADGSEPRNGGGGTFVATPCGAKGCVCAGSGERGALPSGDDGRERLVCESASRRFCSISCTNVRTAPTAGCASERGIPWEDAC